jgi:hypothetical protein
MEFQEKNKVQIGLFSATGSTVELFTPYYSMKDYRRVDFLIAGHVKVPAAGAAGGATDFQRFTCRVMQASNSTGGGASAMSSATAIIGKDLATGFSTAAKCREGWINFETLDKGTDLSITIGTAVYQSASASTAVMRFPVSGASLAATVACQAFVTMFNAATNNTATAITALWEAATAPAAIPWVRIIPKDPDGTHLLSMSGTNGTMVGFGGVFTGHIGIDRQFMADGKTHIALGIKSTEHGNPFAVTIIREADYPPVKIIEYSKSMNQSTSK